MLYSDFLSFFLSFFLSLFRFSKTVFFVCVCCVLCVVCVCVVFARLTLALKECF